MPSAQDVDLSDFFFDGRWNKNEKLSQIKPPLIVPKLVFLIGGRHDTDWCDLGSLNLSTV